jgi:hypothetical protein
MAVVKKMFVKLSQGGATQQHQTLEFRIQETLGRSRRQKLGRSGFNHHHLDIENQNKLTRFTLLIETDNPETLFSQNICEIG